MAEPTGTSTLGVVTEADVRAAQTAVDAVDGLEGVELTVAGRLAVRGLLAAFVADVRWAGYVEGKVRGRELLAREVRELLDGE